MNQAVELRPVRVEIADEAEAIDHFVADKIGVVAAYLGMMLCSSNTRRIGQMTSHKATLSDDERAGPALPESRERILVLVDDGDVPALLMELERDRRADAPAADHQRLET